MDNKLNTGARAYLGRKPPIGVGMKGVRAKDTKDALVMFSEKGSYLRTLQERKATSRAHKKHQLIGLELAALLDDPGHKSFYIKLAKQINAEELFGVAKDIAQRKNVRNKGAYFMRMIHLAKQTKE